MSEKSIIKCKAFISGDSGYYSILKNIYSKVNIELDKVNHLSELENEQELVLYFIFSEDELGFFESKYFQNRLAKGFETIITLFFSNEFFGIPEGEVPAYIPLIKFYSQFTAYPVSAFLSEEITDKSLNFSSFVNVISSLITLKYELKTNNHYIDELEKKILSLAKNSDEDILFNKLLYNYIKELYAYGNELSKRINNIKKEFSQIAGNISSIQEKNEKLAISKYNFYKYENPSDSALVNKITLKYGSILSKINLFIESIEGNPLLQSDKELLLKCRDTKNNLSIVCKMAVLGTFSSGKTTFVNSLLMSEHKLRTSASHNSAVLLNINAAKDEEYYRIFYKNKIQFDLLKAIEYDNLAQLYEKSEKLTVINIDNVCNIIQARNDNNETRNINVAYNKTIIVKKGDILLTGTKLTEGFSKIRLSDSEDYKVNCVSKDDVISIINQINKGYLVDYKIELIKEDESTNIINQREASKYLDYFKQKFTSADVHFLASEILNNFNLTGVVKVTFYGNYKKQNEIIKLNDSYSWKKFCDNADGSIYLEHPDCYIFAKEVQLFMKSKFLDNCSIVDTPGFGSVSENHDAISECYLREHKGILLIMVRIDIHAESNRFRALINNINQIAKSSSELKKEKIYFILNCFSHNIKEESLKEKCKTIYQFLIQTDFNKENIFICNMKRSLEYGEYFKEMYGYPSYDVFREQLFKEIETEGQLLQLNQIKTEWKDYFKNKSIKVKESLQEKEASEQDRKKRYEEIVKKLEELDSINVKKYSELTIEINEQFNLFINDIKCIEKKKELVNEKDDFANNLGKLCDNLYKEDILTEYYDNIVLKIKMLTDGIFVEIPDTEKKHFHFARNAVEEKYDKTINAKWGAFWWKKNKELVSNLTVYIQEQLANSIDGYKKYYDYIESRINEIKESTRNELIRQKDSYKDDVAIQASIEKDKKLLEELKNKQKENEKIAEEIDTYVS